VLVGLYEEPDRPGNAVDYIKRYMGAPANVDVEGLKVMRGVCSVCVPLVRGAWRVYVSVSVSEMGCDRSIGTLVWLGWGGQSIGGVVNRSVGWPIDRS
jgi:hypothetical protein